MARLFADTSALIKLYRTEPDSAAVQACVTEDDDLIISQLALLEFRSAFAVHVRMRLLSSGDASTYVAAFLGTLSRYEVVDLEPAIAARASLLLDAYAVSHGLRSLDAIQLASALAANAAQPLDALLTTDQAMATIAVTEGLTIKP